MFAIKKTFSTWYSFAPWTGHDLDHMDLISHIDHTDHIDHTSIIHHIHHTNQIDHTDHIDLVDPIAAVVRCCAGSVYV